MWCVKNSAIELYCSHVRFSFYEQLLCVLLVCVLGLVLRAVIRATPMLPHCPDLLSLFSVVFLLLTLGKICDDDDDDDDDDANPAPVSRGIPDSGVD